MTNFVTRKMPTPVKLAGLAVLAVAVVGVGGCCVCDPNAVPYGGTTYNGQVLNAPSDVVVQRAEAERQMNEFNAQQAAWGDYDRPFPPSPYGYSTYGNAQIINVNFTIDTY